MPKKVVENIKVMKLPYFPVLSGQKRSRVITKHFTNTALYLPYNQFCLLTWLIYQSNVDNSFVYDGELINRYLAAVKEAGNLYGNRNKLHTDIKAIRGDIKQLIENGYILPTSTKATLIINPMLSYRPEYCRSGEYKKCCDVYQDVMVEGEFAGVKWFSDEYRKVINEKIAKKVKR